jgi:hypothetical protein
MTNEIIKIKQLPVLEEQFNAAGAEVDKRLAIVADMVVTDENRKEVKKIRAELNKEFKAFEDQYKKIKSEVLEPWLKVEAAYKENIKEKYSAADKTLKTRIDEIENELKDEKAEKLKNWYMEYAAALNVSSFAIWPIPDLKIGLTESDKKLRDGAKAYIDAIVSDLELIETQEHAAEIMAEYKLSRNASAAIKAVVDRKEREAAEAEAAREREAAKAEEMKRQAEFAQATQPETIAPAATAEAIEPPTVDQPEQPEQYIAFKVYGSREEMKAVIGFMRSNNIRFEQIQA